MVEVMDFVFTNFWTFIGTWILISVPVNGIVNIVRALCNYHTDITWFK